MNWILKIAPKWLTKIDTFLRINYVWIWATRIHLMLYFCLLLTLFFALIFGIYPLDIKNLLNVRDISNYYIPLLIPAFLLMGFYVFQAVLFNPDKRYTRGKNWHSIVVFLCMQLGMFLPFLIPFSTAVILNVKIANIVSDEEFIKDRNSFLTCGFYLHNASDYFGYYENDDAYLKSDNKIYFEPLFRRNGQNYDDYEKKALRDSIYFHKGVFKNNRPKLYRNANVTTDDLYLNSEFLKNPFIKTKLDSAVLDFYIEQNINFSDEVAVNQIGKLNYLLSKYSYFDLIDATKIINDKKNNNYIGYNFKSSTYSYNNYENYDYTADYYYNSKLNDLNSTLTNIVVAKANFIPRSISSFISVMFYVTYFLTVLILLFKWINWKQFLLFLLIIGVLLALIGVFEAIFSFRGFLILNIGLLFLIVGFIFTFKSYVSKTFKWWNNQWSIFIFLFMPNIFIFLLGYFSVVLNFWHWDYFKQKYYKNQYNGYDWSWQYTEEFYKLQSQVSFYSFHSGLLMFVLLLPFLHKVFMRLHALPKRS